MSSGHAHSHVLPWVLPTSEVDSLAASFLAHYADLLQPRPPSPLSADLPFAMSDDASFEQRRASAGGDEAGGQDGEVGSGAAGDDAHRFELLCNLSSSGLGFGGSALLNSDCLLEDLDRDLHQLASS